MVQLGLIGAGRWGRSYIHTLKDMPGVRLTRLASTNPESTSLVEQDCSISSDWREVATDKSLHGVIIATPPSLHAQMAETALASGLHVLVEKPMTMSRKEARLLLDASRASSRMVFVAHTHLFSNAFRTLKEKSQELGKLKMIRSFAGNWGPYRADTDVLWDWAPHDIAMSLDLLGADPQRVGVQRTRTAQLPQGTGEAVEITLGFSDDVHSLIRVSNIDSKKSRYFEAEFEKGTLVYDDMAEGKLRITTRPGLPGDLLPIDAAMPLEVLTSEFAAEIREGAHFHSSLPLGVRVVDLLAACQEMLEADKQGISS